MKRPDRDAASAALACDVCGQLPHPHKVRLTVLVIWVAEPSVRRALRD